MQKDGARLGAGELSRFPDLRGRKRSVHTKGHGYSAKCFAKPEDKDKCRANQTAEFLKWQVSFPSSVPKDHEQGTKLEPPGGGGRAPGCALLQRAEAWEILSQTRFWGKRGGLDWGMTDDEPLSPKENFIRRLLTKLPAIVSGLSQPAARTSHWTTLGHPEH